MTTNPPLFGADRDRPEAVLDEVETRLGELVGGGAAGDAAGDRGRVRAWFADDTRFFSTVAVVIVATAIGLASLVSATRPEAPAPAPEVVAAPVEVPEREPQPEPAPEPESELLPPPLPLTLRIDAIGVDAPLVSVGLEPDGAMEIPDDVREVGWYDPDDLGVRPGTTGTAVFASHVDSRTQGRGVLFELRRMRVGETIEIDLEDGTTQTWVVTEVAQIPKVAMPLNEIFTWAGPPRTVIITCGGEFDRSARSYVDNIVVYAEPLDGAPTQAEDAPSA